MPQMQAVSRERTAISTKVNPWEELSTLQPLRRYGASSKTCCLIKFLEQRHREIFSLTLLSGHPRACKSEACVFLLEACWQPLRNTSDKAADIIVSGLVLDRGLQTNLPIGDLERPLWESPWIDSIAPCYMCLDCFGLVFWDSRWTLTDKLSCAESTGETEPNPVPGITPHQAPANFGSRCWCWSPGQSRVGADFQRVHFLSKQP